MLGETLGNYKLLSKLGEGGMGVVYLAEHTLIGRKAAVKMLRAECSQSPEIVQRFFNEARSTAMLRHSGLVDVFDFGKHPDGSAYIVMEFLEGESLAQRIDRGVSFPAETIVNLTRQLASAVGAAHGKGIVHRDLKPDNVFLVIDDIEGGLKVKVLDFGIAKLAGEAAGSAGGGSIKTRTGSMMGTPLYMAPEQCRGAGEVDRRADIYSVGCIMYEMAVGQPPFIGEGPGDVIVGHMKEPPLPPRQLRPDLPSALEAIILRALAKRPADRQQTMEELGAELDQVVGRRRGSAEELAPASGVRSRSGIALDDTHASSPGMTPTPISEHPSTTPVPREPTGMHGETAPPQAALPSILIEQPVTPPVRTTTFRSAAGESLHRTPPPRRGFVLPAIAVGAALLAGVLWFVLKQSNQSSGKRRQAAASPSPSASAAVTVALTVDSTPAGAEVFRGADGVLLGETPFRVELPRGEGSAMFILKKAGYQDARVVLPLGAPGRQAVDLVALPAASPALAAGVPSPSPSPPAKTRNKRERKNRPGTSVGGGVRVNDGMVDPFK